MSLYIVGLIYFTFIAILNSVFQGKIKEYLVRKNNKTIGK